MVESAIALLILVGGADTMKQDREAFGRCLKELVKSGVEKKMDLVAFTTELNGACKDKEQALRASLAAADAKLGMKRAASEKSINEQIVDYRTMAKEDFEAMPK